LITPNLVVGKQYMAKVMFKQLKNLIKGCNKAVVKNDANLKPFKATLLPLFKFIKDD
jgi:hypothetical protein